MEIITEEYEQQAKPKTSSNEGKGEKGEKEKMFKIQGVPNVNYSFLTFNFLAAGKAHNK